MSAGKESTHTREASQADSQVPPHDNGAEDALLSAMLLTPTAIEKAKEAGCLPEHFWSPSRQAICRAIFAEYAETGRVDEIVVVDRLRRAGELDIAGGDLAVLALGRPDPIPAVSLAHRYAEIVRGHAEGRRMIKLASDLLTAAYGGGDVGPQVEAINTLWRDRSLGRDRVVTGDALLHLPSVNESALWGAGDRVGWAEGSALLIVGPPGIGKTTLAGQLVAARMGLNPIVLGFPVKAGRRVLYLASDRPAQIMRAMARNLASADEETLRERLAIYRGPLLPQVTTDPLVLADVAHAHGADTLIIDSLKDISPGLNSDEHGAAINTAMQHALAAGVEVVALHHHHKTEREPRALNGLYGSVLIAAGAGSVLSLYPGADGRVKVQHLKTDAGELGVDEIEFDTYAGTCRVTKGMPDVFSVVSEQGCLTAMELAVIFTGDPEPSDHHIRKARTALGREVRVGRLRVAHGGIGGAGQGGREPDLYCVAERDAP